MSSRPEPSNDVRTLWLLRHAKTVGDPPPGGADFDRELAPRGRRDATALGHLLADRPDERDGAPWALRDVPVPRVALVSSAARTTTTAELALAHLSEPPELRRRDELYGASPEEVLAMLRTLPDEIDTAMVVGHNPTVQVLALELLAPDDDTGRSRVAQRGFSTCALGVYGFESASWADVRSNAATLVALVRPPY